MTIATRLRTHNAALAAQDADLTARLVAAEAERDVAVAAALLAGAQMLEFGDRQYGEGKHAATAAIVADLRGMGGDPDNARINLDLPVILRSLADRYERGDHLTPATPPPAPGA